MHCLKYRFAGPLNTVHIGTSSRVVWRGTEKSLASTQFVELRRLAGCWKVLNPDAVYVWRRLHRFSKSDHGYSVLMVSYVDLHDFGGCWKVFSPTYNSEIGSFDAAHSVIIQFTVPCATTQ